MNELTRVALTLSAVVRLEQMFHEATSTTFKAELLKAAGDILDKTVPPEDVKKSVPKEPGKLIPYLVRHVGVLGAVPPGLWRKPNADLRKLEFGASEHIRRFEALLKKGSCSKTTWVSTLSWLAPVWVHYPELQKVVMEAEAPIKD